MNRAVVGICSNPLIGMHPRDMRVCDLGVSISSLAPVARGALVCRVNGEWLLRESWASRTKPGDVVEFYDLPQDKEDVRGLLQVAAIFASFIPGLQPFAAYLYAANAAYNLLVPPSPPKQQARPQETGDTFSTSLTGNQARLDQPIWRICGRREINPPFAAAPYFEFLPKVGEADPNLDNEQYYYALLAIGVGDYDVVAKIGNTPLSRFADIVTAQYLAPGVAPTAVAANITTADEVSSQILETGRYVGGFAACAAQRTCAFIGVDVVATRGLGDTGPLTVTWRVESRPINDFGQAVGSWAVVGTESRTAFTSTPQRWSSKYVISPPARVEVRLVRTDTKDTNPQALHEIAWTGLRAYLAEPAPLNEHTAHFELVLRGSSQLSNNAARDVRLITYGKCRPLNSDLTWGAVQRTRNWVWWCLDLITSTTWGMSRPDDRVDLQSFYDLGVEAEARQDRFDYTFDSTLNGWDAAQLIARAGRSRVFRRNGVISIARDGLADLGVTAFTPRNCESGMSIGEKLRTRRSPDGIVAEYQDHRTWEWTAIEVPLPGVSETDVQDPIRVRLEGVVGETHARREALYEAANLLYRTRLVSFKTEMHGVLPAYMSPVDFIADVEGYGSSGDVAFWDAGTLTATLTEPADFSAGPLELTLQRDDGSLTDPVTVTPGATAYEVVLPAAPDFDLVLARADRERPRYLLGVRDLVKVLAIEDGGKTDDGAQLFQLRGVIDDGRVHTADIAFLPGPGDIQDPVGDPDEDPGEDGLYIVTLSNHVIAGVNMESGAAAAYYRHYGDGRASADTDSGIAGGTVDSAPNFSTEVFFENQWLSFAPWDTVVTANYEVRATLLDGSIDAGTLNTWLPGDGDYEWSLGVPTATMSQTANLLIEVRDVATEIVQSSATITLSAVSDTIGGGG